MSITVHEMLAAGLGQAEAPNRIIVSPHVMKLLNRLLVVMTPKRYWGDIGPDAVEWLERKQQRRRRMARKRKRGWA